MTPRQTLVVILLVGVCFLLFEAVSFQVANHLRPVCTVVVEREFYSPTKKYRIFTQEVSCGTNESELVVNIADPNDSSHFVSRVRVPVRFQDSTGREHNPVSFSVKWLSDSEAELGYPADLKALRTNSTSKTTQISMPDRTEEFGLTLKWVPHAP